nr:glycerol kinase [Seculamonas ecuadoriensis]
MQRRFLGAIDQGTSSTRFILFEASTLRPFGSYQRVLTVSSPHPAWSELDPIEILDSVYECMIETLKTSSVSVDEIASIGITNQRESTIAWDATTGKPLYNAILWNDARTSSICQHLSSQQLDLGDGGEQRAPGAHQLADLCGLPISTYFSAPKISWMLSNVPAIREAVDHGRCLFGTVDSWLIWNMTGGVNGGAHVTDPSNASRTMLMNLHTLKWDDCLCSVFSVDPKTLPRICSSDDRFGTIVNPAPFAGVPITGCLGDQQAALVGQKCFKPGQSKNTYGTGTFLLAHAGSTPPAASKGLLRTVGYVLKGQKCYAVEGSVAVAGSGIRWLRDNLGVIASAEESETLAASVPDTGNVFFVPAFAGLFAPYWRSDARGTIVGLTQFSTKAHIVRAMLESVCLQTREVVDSMKSDCGIELESMNVDGGMTSNKTFLQMQADVLGIPVIRPEYAETTALGAAIAAGLGCGVYNSLDDVLNIGSDEVSVYKPVWTAAQRARHMKKWKAAVERSFNWFTDAPEEDDEEVDALA